MNTIDEAIINELNEASGNQKVNVIAKMMIKKN